MNGRPRRSSGFTRLRLCLAPEVEPGNETLAVPHLAFVAVVPFARDRDRAVVVVRFDPFGGRDLVRPVEAVNSVVCHLFTPCFPSAARSGVSDEERVWRGF